MIANENVVANPQDCYRRIAVADQSVYWSSGSAIHPIGCAIRAVPVSGGMVSTLVDQAFMVDFTVDDVSVYFSECETNAVRKVPVGGGAVSLVASDVQAWVMTNDSENLYWLDLQQGSAGGMEKTAGPAEWLLIPPEVPMDPFLAFEALFIDQTGFYVSETWTGTIYRIY